MQPPVPEPPAKRAADFARRNYHWIFAALAALLVLARYMPAVYLSALDSDNIQIPLLFHDVIEQGHSARDWVWGGHSDLFPDISIVFLVEFILRNGLLSLQAASGIFLAAYVAVLVVLYRQNGGRNAGTFAAMVLLFFVLLLINFGLHDGMEFISISSFVVPMHTSISIMALGCFALCQRVALQACSRSFWWLLSALCFVTALSNDLFLVIFTGPALAALVITRLLYAGRVRWFPRLFGNIIIASAAGHFLARRLSPFQIDPGPFTSFHASLAAAAWHQFLASCKPSAGGIFIIFVTLDFLFILFMTFLVTLLFFKPAARRIPAPFFMLLVFSAYAIGCNWGAVILTGDFSTILAARYTRLAMLLPVFLLLGCINHVVPWSKAAGRAAITACSLAVSMCALFLTPSPSKYYQETQQLIPIIRGEMEKEHIQAGLADYWYANPITFFSRNTLPIRAVNIDGSLFHWVNSIGWYAGEGASNPPPQFRLILMANLDPDKIRRRYGAPDRIIHTPPGKDIWIYTTGESITYSYVFQALSRGPIDEFRIDGDMLPSLTGLREGTSRVARAGRDRLTFMTFGPYPYLRPAPGNYRITISYTWLSAPAPGKLAGYDVTYFTGSSSQTLDKGTLPYVDNTRQELTFDIGISDNKRGLFQVRTKFNGSGDISIDSLKIVYLGKG